MINIKEFSKMSKYLHKLRKRRHWLRYDPLGYWWPPIGHNFGHKNYARLIKELLPLPYREFLPRWWNRRQKTLSAKFRIFKWMRAAAAVSRYHCRNIPSRMQEPISLLETSFQPSILAQPMLCNDGGDEQQLLKFVERKLVRTEISWFLSPLLDFQLFRTII